jgi:hypothetical protein
VRASSSVWLVTKSQGHCHTLLHRLLRPLHTCQSASRLKAFQRTLLATPRVQHNKGLVQAPAKYACAEQRRTASRWLMQRFHISNIQARMAALASERLLHACSHCLLGAAALSNGA